MDERVVRWLLAGTASLGVVGVGVSSAAITKKLVEKKATMKEKVASYIPVVGIGILTIGCIVAANVIGDEAIATMSALVLLADEAYMKRKETSDEAVREIAEDNGLTMSDVAKDIFRRKRPPRVGREEELWYDGLRGLNGYFGASELDMWIALYLLNRKMQIDGEVTLAYFYKKLHLSIPEGADEVGWSIGAGVVYGYSFIDCTWETYPYDDNLECNFITFPYPPTSDYLLYTPDEGAWQGWESAKKADHIMN